MLHAGFAGVAASQSRDRDMILKNLSTELAQTWAREMLISGWTSSTVLAAIRALDEAKPLERRKMLVRWSLPYPRVETDPLIDEDGEPLRRADGRKAVRASVDNDRLAEHAARREQARTESRMATQRKREAAAIAKWQRWDSGQLKREPTMPRPVAMAA